MCMWTKNSVLRATAFNVAACGLAAVCALATGLGAVAEAGETEGLTAEREDAVEQDSVEQDSVEQDSIVLEFTDGRILKFPAAELRRVSYLTRRSAYARELPVTKKHVLVSLDDQVHHGKPGEANGWVTIRQDDVESPEWQAAIADAKKHQGGRGYYTLFRVRLDDGAPEDRIQLAGSKLKQLSAKYNGGGGRYRVETSGAFVLLEHINSTSRKSGKDPLEVGSIGYGQATLWVTVPEAGTLNVLGDVVVGWPANEDRGELRLEVLPSEIRMPETARIGTIAVGGPYGESWRFEDRECRVPDLTAGTYKLLLPDFEVRASRWDVKIAPGMVTHLQFEIRSEDQIVKVRESYVPMKTR